jgi:hypothetical protein
MPTRNAQRLPLCPPEACPWALLECPPLECPPPCEPLEPPCEADPRDSLPRLRLKPPARRARFTSSGSSFAAGEPAVARVSSVSFSSPVHDRAAPETDVVKLAGIVGENRRLHHLPIRTRSEMSRPLRYHVPSLDLLSLTFPFHARLTAG